MELSENLRDIIKKAYHKNKVEAIRLTLRKDRPTEDKSNRSTHILPREEQVSVMIPWWEFHNRLAHGKLDTICSKSKFCCSPLLESVDAERFLQLVADRTFLFLEYNEHRNEPNCPSLRSICTQPTIYKMERVAVEFRKEAEVAATALKDLLDGTVEEWKEKLEAAYAEWERSGESMGARGAFDNYVCRRWNLPQEGECHTTIRKSLVKFLRFCQVMQNAEIALQQGFIPTEGHRADLEELQHNRQRIQEALNRRQAHWQRCGLEKGTNEALQLLPFKIALRARPEACMPEARALSRLFRAYLKAAYTYAYKREYEPYLDGEPDWTSEMEQVLEQIEAQGRQEDRRLILYTLFTGQTKKLASHTLRRCTCEKSGALKRAAYWPKKTQDTIAHRNECNILLFDYLLRCFPPENKEEEAYEKFRFYLFTHYQGYVHYKTNWPKDDDEFAFDFVPDWEDGVDELGYLLRRNIFACMPNRMEWFTPDLNCKYWEVAVELVPRLLHDAQINHSAFRLTNRIRAFLRDDASAEVRKKFAEQQDNSYAILNLLNQTCQDNEFTFQMESQLHATEKWRKESYLAYGRYLLEFELRERLIRQARHRLFQRAEQLFADCFCVEDPFYLHNESNGEV